MMKINKITIFAAFILSFVVIELPKFAYAQTAAPGTSGGRATVNDYLNQAQQNETNRIDASKGQDTGDNYGASDVILDAGKEAAQDVKDTYEESVKEYQNAESGWGKFKAILSGIVKTGASASLSFIRASVNAFDNLQLLGQDVYVYTDPYTGEEKQYVKTIFGGAVATEGSLKGCPPIPIAIADASSCIFCPLFAVIYGAAQEMAELSFAKLGKAMATVMLVGFALYIAFKVLSHVSSFTRQDAPSFINELLVQSFKVLLAFLFLMNPDQIYQHFISPVLGAGLEFGSAMLFQASDMAQQCVSLTVENDTALLPVSLYARLDCFVRAVQNEIAVTQAIGSSLMCAGRHAAAGKIAGFWDFNMVFQGLIIWAFAIMLSLAFAFYLIDAVVTLGLVSALMPFLIACWPFKITNKYSKTGIELFLNVFFIFVFMGIVVSINTQLIGQALNGGTTSTSSSSSTSTSSSSSSSNTTSTGASSGNTSSSGTSSTGTSGTGTSAPTASTSGGLGTLAEALSGDNIDKVKELTDLGFSGFLIIIFCCIFGFKFSNHSSTLANKMAGGAGINIAPGIGGMAAKGAKDLAAKATQPARKAAANKANEMTSKAGNAVAAKLGLGKFGGKTGAGGNASSKGGTPAPTGGNGSSQGGTPAPTSGNGGGQNRQSPTEGGGNKEDLHNERNAGGNGGTPTPSGGNGGVDSNSGNDDGTNTSGSGNNAGNGGTQTQSSGPTGADGGAGGSQTQTSSSGPTGAGGGAGNNGSVGSNAAENGNGGNNTHGSGS